MAGEGLDTEPSTGHGHQAAGQTADGPLKTTGMLPTLAKLAPQPFGLGNTPGQLTLQALLFLGKVLGVEPGLLEPCVQAGMTGGLSDQLALQLLDLGSQQPLLFGQRLGVTAACLLLAAQLLQLVTAEHGRQFELGQGGL